MTKQIPAWEFWDWRSILGTIAIISILIAFFAVFMNSPDFFRHQHEKRYNSETNATVLSLHQNTQMSQGKMGAHLNVHSVSITYQFRDNDRIYIGSDELPYSSIRDIQFVDSLLSGSIKTVSVKYLFQNPNENHVVIQ